MRWRRCASASARAWRRSSRGFEDLSPQRRGGTQRNAEENGSCWLLLRAHVSLREGNELSAFLPVLCVLRRSCWRCYTPILNDLRIRRLHPSHSRVGVHPPERDRHRQRG